MDSGEKRLVPSMTSCRVFDLTASVNQLCDVFTSNETDYIFLMAWRSLPAKSIPPLIRKDELRGIGGVQLWQAAQMIVCDDENRSFSRVRRRRCMTVEARGSRNRSANSA